jgi:YVTN family beta-propeller protein
LFTTEKVHGIYLRISLAVLIYTSTIAFSYHAEAVKSLDTLEDERSKNPEISLGRQPTDLAVDDEGTIFLSHTDHDVISVINGDTLEVSTIHVGNSPTGIAVDNSRNLVFVANSDSNTVSIIELTEGQYRNIANVNSGGINPYRVFVEGNSTYVISQDGKYPVSIIRESSSGEWKNVKNITLEDPDKITEIAVVGENTTYVGRSYSSSNNTVSIIEDLDGRYENVTNISVGFSPLLISAGPYDSLLARPSEPSAYVSLNGKLSIIKNYLGEYKNTANVSILGGPSYQTENFYTEDIFITNFYNDSVSVLDGGNYTNIANISVGDSPSAVVVDSPFYFDGDSIYVANFGSESVSVINAYTHKLRVGISLEAEPSHAGQIECGGTDVPTNQYFYIDFPSSCTARANQGFQFSSWIEDLGNSSTRIINASTASNSPIDWLTNALTRTNDTTNILTPTKFGKFVAIFEEVPPPFPPEYLIPLYGIIVSSVVGWSIPSIVSWIRAKREGRISDDYHKRIQSLYNDGKLDHADIKPLNKIRNDLSNTYAKGKISEQQYQNLKGETGVLYEEIHRKRIDFLDGPLKHNSKDDRLLTTIKKDIDDDFAKGKISKEHYDLLNKKIESFVNTDENKKR